MIGEFWWWTRREISRNHRLTFSLSDSTKTAWTEQSERIVNKKNFMASSHGQGSTA